MMERSVVLAQLEAYKVFLKQKGTFQTSTSPVDSVNLLTPGALASGGLQRCVISGQG